VRDEGGSCAPTPGDVVIRVTSSAICGTDLHMYDGRTGAERALVLGHERLGTIEEVGAAVTLLRPDEPVAVPTHLFCGTWSWPVVPVPAASSPTMAAWRTRLACTSASSGAPTG